MAKPVDTGYNFVRTLPMVAIVGIVSFSLMQFSIEGILLVCLSGGIASGVGYTIWYTALRGFDRGAWAFLWGQYLRMRKSSGRSPSGHLLDPKYDRSEIGRYHNGNGGECCSDRGESLSDFL